MSLGLEDGWVWKESLAVMDGDGSQMLRGRMGTETISDGNGWGHPHDTTGAVMDGDGLISHYHAGL